MLRIIYSLCFIFLLVACNKKDSQPLRGNRAPVANAGKDDTIDINSYDYVLDGRASYDPDKDVLQYVWLQISGPRPQFLKQNQNQPTAVVATLKEGSYEFELTVTDGLLLSDKDTMVLKVIDTFATGKTPVINIDCNKSVSVPVGVDTVDILTTVYVENSEGKKLYLSDGVSAKQIQGPSVSGVQQSYLDYTKTIIPVTNLIKGTYRYLIEVNRKGISSYDTATINVIEDQVTGKEFVFETKWEAISEEAVSAKTSNNPEIFYMARIREPAVSILLENSNEWEDMSGNGGGIRFFNCYSMMEVVFYNQDYPDMVGNKVKIKVKF